MINIPITKLLFLDIETVGVHPNFETLESVNPELSFQFKNYFDWFQKRFPEDADKGHSQMFVNMVFSTFCHIMVKVKDVHFLIQL